MGGPFSLISGPRRGPWGAPGPLEGMGGARRRPAVGGTDGTHGTQTVRLGFNQNAQLCLNLKACLGAEERPGRPEDEEDDEDGRPEEVGEEEREEADNTGRVVHEEVLIDTVRACALRVQRSWMRRQVETAQKFVEAETELRQQFDKEPDIAEEVRHERNLFNRRLRLLKLVIADNAIGERQQEERQEDLQASEDALRDEIFRAKQCVAEPRDSLTRVTPPSAQYESLMTVGNMKAVWWKFDTASTKDEINEIASSLSEPKEALKSLVEATRTSKLCLQQAIRGAYKDRGRLAEIAHAPQQQAARAPAPGKASAPANDGGAGYTELFECAKARGIPVSCHMMEQGAGKGGSTIAQTLGVEQPFVVRFPAGHPMFKSSHLKSVVDALRDSPI